MTATPRSVEPCAVAAKGSTDLVQPIAILKTGSHWSTIKAAAAASAFAFVRDSGQSSEWGPWLAGVYAKSVRRSNMPGLDRVVDLLPGAARVRVGDAVAVATRPYAYADLPRPLARMQVAGTDLAREPLPRVDDPLFVVWLSGSLDMTTGKCAAQAAHAVSAIVREHLPDEVLQAWVREPARFDVSPVDADELLARSRRAPVMIRDAGHTEVAAGSLTAVASLSDT